MAEEWMWPLRPLSVDLASLMGEDWRQVHASWQQLQPPWFRTEDPIGGEGAWGTWLDMSVREMQAASPLSRDAEVFVPAKPGPPAKARPPPQDSTAAEGKAAEENDVPRAKSWEKRMLLQNTI